MDYAVLGDGNLVLFEANWHFYLVSWRYTALPLRPRNERAQREGV